MRPQTQLAILSASGEAQTLDLVRLRVLLRNSCQSRNFTE